MEIGMYTKAYGNSLSVPLRYEWFLKIVRLASIPKRKVVLNKIKKSYGGKAILNCRSIFLSRI